MCRASARREPARTHVLRGRQLSKKTSLRVRCQWPDSVRPKTHAWLWNHREQLKSLGLMCLILSHPRSRVHMVHARPPKRYHWYPQSPSSCRLLPLRSRHRIRAGRPPLDSYPLGAPTAEATETYLNTYADIRVEQYLRSPPVIQTGIDISDSHPPRESDHDTEILSQSATEAFQRLIDAIDNPSPTPLDIDDQLYSALAGLSSSHPWSTLVLDLKGVLHELDRHFHTHLLSGMLQAQMVPSKIQLLNQLLQSLSAVIVDILAPATSNFNLPEIESVFFTHQFWHHHLVHGTNIATPASLEGAPSDTLLGDQLCQWSSVGATADSLLLASHLTVHLPPRIGAYVLANHKTHASLVTDPEVAGQNRSNYVVKQRSQYRSPIMGSDMALTAARASASAGHVPPSLVPLGFS